MTSANNSYWMLTRMEMEKLTTKNFTIWWARNCIKMLSKLKKLLKMFYCLRFLDVNRFKLTSNHSFIYLPIKLVSCYDLKLLWFMRSCLFWNKCTYTISQIIKHTVLDIQYCGILSSWFLASLRANRQKVSCQVRHV